MEKLPENFFENKRFNFGRFADLRGLDLSHKGLKDTSIEILIQANFDEGTKWPSIENLPSNFNPEIVLENGKNPGLRIKNLHEQGITGKGVNIGIIDQNLILIILSMQEIFHITLK